MTLRGILLAAALAGSLGAVPAHAALLCDTPPCQVVLEFPGGGSIEPEQGAEIAFGAGGVLLLGDGGSIVYGSDGFGEPATTGSEVPDMGGGGRIVLGPGGSIHFGPGGRVHTGDGGQLAAPDGSRLLIDGALTVDIDADASVHLGRLQNSGEYYFEAQYIEATGEPAPFDIVTRNDSAARIAVNSRGTIHVESLNDDGSGMVFSTPGDSSEPPATSPPPGGAGSGAVISVGSGSISIGDFDPGIVTASPGAISIGTGVFLPPVYAGTITAVGDGVLVPAPAVPTAPPVIVIDPLSRLLTSRYSRAAPADEPAGSFPRNAAMAGSEGGGEGGGAFPALILLLLGGLRYAARRPRR